MVLFMIGTFYIPVLGSLMAIFLPLPVMVLTIKNRVPYVIVATLVASLLAGMLITIISSFGMGVMALMVGLPLGLGIKHKKEGFFTVIFGAMGAMIGFYVTFSLLELITGIGLYETIDLTLRESFEMQRTMLTASSALSPENVAMALEQVERTTEQLLTMLALLFPSIMLLMSVMYAWINYAFAPKVLRRLRLESPESKPFSEFTYPRHFAYGASGMLALAWLLGALKLIDPILIMSNFSYLFHMIFLIQALAVIYAYFKKKMQKGPSVLLTVLVVAFIPFQFLSFLGFFDVLFNFRKLNA